MKKDEGRGLISLAKLYLTYHMNRITLILFGIILLLWTIVLFLNTSCPIQMDTYIVSFKSYHSYYNEQSIFFLQMIDGVFVAFLVGAELSSFDYFDPMFVPNVSRNKIILAKILANSIILLLMQTFQILLFFLISVIVFPYYSFHYQNLLLIFFIFLPLFELFLVGELISMIIHSYFIPILIFVLHIMTMLLTKLEQISTTLVLFIPRIQFVAEQIYLEGNAFLYLGICILILGSIILIFQKKDISNS